MAKANMKITEPQRAMLIAIRDGDIDYMDCATHGIAIRLRLQNKKLIQSGGERRSGYALTDAGRKALS